MKQEQKIASQALRQFVDRGCVFAILDVCISPQIPQKAQECDASVARCLFQETPLEDYYAVAPYLFQIDTTLLDWIANSFGRQPWGVFLLSAADLSTICQHLRRFFMAVLPDGNRWFFRYYDPRVLGVYIEHWNASELQTFFGPVRAYVVPSGESLCVLENKPILIQPLQLLTDREPLWRITPEQFEALRHNAHENFIAGLIAHLRIKCPRRAATGEPEMLRFVNYAWERARQAGFNTEYQVYGFCEVLLALGSNFEHKFFQLWAHRIMNTPGLTLDDKTQRLVWAKDFTLASGILDDDSGLEIDAFEADHGQPNQ